ncbi:hypothetical protein KJ866_00510 [Patescibacteria group bacterium]|nr:hypothetical protein [Patescibacteria group bacterium]MBU2220246.1 hypothetical protein [Patescibacteria group bacterium]MBU2265086.1 hypothetical protein [Patescibacteria group bacterium]
MGEHQHLWQKGVSGGFVAVNKCGCGAIICSSPSPDDMHDCNLEIGHPGPCRNTFHPGAGIWREKPEEPPMKILVTRQSVGYRAHLEARPEEVWGRGETGDAAIGDLIHSHACIFNIELEHQ